MSTFTPNVAKLREELSNYDIDINRVDKAGLDETGYNYRMQFEDGRPKYDSAKGPFVIQRERKQWPSPEVWDLVNELYFGNIKPEADPEPVEDKPAPAKDTEPAKIKPAAKETKTP